MAMAIQNPPQNAFLLFKKLLHLLAINLLSLSLPLSFLLFSRLVRSHHLHTFLPHPAIASADRFLLLSLISLIAVSALLDNLFGKSILPAKSSGLTAAWLVLCSLQIGMALGIDEGMAVAIDAASSLGLRRSLWWRLMFFLGLHTAMIHWSKTAVRPVVDDTMFGAPVEESWSGRIAMAASFGGLWWWRLRDEAEFPAFVAESKIELVMDPSMADYAGWILYYLVVSIGFVTSLRSFVWFLKFALRDRTEESSSQFSKSKRIEIAGAYFPSNGGDKNQETELRGKDDDFPFRMEEFGDFNFLPVDESNFYQQEVSKVGDQTNYQQPNSDSLNLDELLFGSDFTIAELIQEKSTISDNPAEETISCNSSKQVSNPCLDSLQLLNSYGTNVKRMKGTNLDTRSDEVCEENKKWSTEEIIRVAGARYVHFFPKAYDDSYIPMHPCGFALSGLSEDEVQDVELAHVLFAAAEKVGYQQYERASRLLQRCEWTASPHGNAVQRLVFYFAKALRKRIDRLTGREVTKQPKEEMEITLETLKGYMKLPFQQVMHLTAVQAIFEHVKLSTKVHLIDLEIKSGVQWVAFMQSLVDLKELPSKHLKITAVVSGKNHYIDKVGKWLDNVAESLNIPFSFKAILVSDMMEIKEELFETQEDEMVAIYCPIVLRTMISKPTTLENLMRVIRNLNPSIMVVSEVEANYNLSSFVNRFIESLFFTASLFDCVKTCIEEDEDSRRMLEAICGAGIDNVIATEGSDRVVRCVKIEVWRAFFARFRMEEMELSDSCLSQAKLMLKQFVYGNFCSLEKNGKCLLVGWKETAIISVSAWQFL